MSKKVTGEIDVAIPHVILKNDEASQDLLRELRIDKCADQFVELFDVFVLCRYIVFIDMYGQDRDGGRGRLSADVDTVEIESLFFHTETREVYLDHQKDRINLSKILGSLLVNKAEVYGYLDEAAEEAAEEAAMEEAA